MMTRPHHTLNETGAGKLESRDILIIVLAVALAAVVRVVFYRGFFSPDETNYLRHAAEWWTGRYELEHALFLHETRPLMFAPVAWFFAAFGVSEVTALLWPFTASMLVVILVYLTARLLFGRTTALYTAFCSAFFPLLVMESTRLLPGAIMNLLFALCALCLVVAERTDRRRWFWLLLSGMFYAAIQIAGELGIVLCLAYLAAVIVWRRHSVWSYWPAIAGFALVTAGVVVYHWIETGNPLFKIELSQRIVQQVKAVAPHQPLYYTRMLLAPFSGNGGVFYIAGIGLLVAVFRKNRGALFVGLWFALTWVLLEFGSISLTEYRQLSKEVRYFSVVSIPIVILAGYGMAAIGRFVNGWGAGRWNATLGRRLSVAAVAMVAFLVVTTSAWTLQMQKNARHEQRTSLIELRDHLRANEGNPVYITHWLWNTEAGFFMRFAEDYFPTGYDPYHAVHIASADSTSLNRYVQTLKPGEPMRAGLLMHDERLFAVSQGEVDSWSIQPGEIPEALANIPADWRLVGRFPVSHKYVVALYEIPEGAVWFADDRD